MKEASPNDFRERGILRSPWVWGFLMLTQIVECGLDVHRMAKAGPQDYGMDLVASLGLAAVFLALAASTARPRFRLEPAGLRYLSLGAFRYRFVAWDGIRGVDCRPPKNPAGTYEVELQFEGRAYCSAQLERGEALRLLARLRPASAGAVWTPAALEQLPAPLRDGGR